MAFFGKILSLPRLNNVNGRYYFHRDGHQEIEPAQANHLKPPSKLRWNLTNKVKEEIQQSAADLDR